MSLKLPERGRELLYNDDLVLMSEIIEGLGNNFYNGSRFLRASLKVNLGKTKVMVNNGITQDGLSKSEVNPCRVCSLRVKANSVLCVLCGKWKHM